jgi:hypothetical protein
MLIPLTSTKGGRTVLFRRAVLPTARAAFLKLWRGQRAWMAHVLGSLCVPKIRFCNIDVLMVKAAKDRS